MVGMLQLANARLRRIFSQLQGAIASSLHGSFATETN